MNPFAGSCWQAPTQEKKVVPLLPDSESLGVSFRPGQIPFFADIRSAELVNKIIELPKVPGISTDFLGEGLLHAKGVDARLAFIELVFRKIGIEAFFQEKICVVAAARLSPRVKAKSKSTNWPLKLEPVSGHWKEPL